VVFLGAGLGYHAEALLGETSSTHIIAHEPEPALAEHLADAARAPGVVSSPRVTVTTSPAELQTALEAHATAGFEVITLPGRREASPETFTAADAVVSAFTSRREINTNTLARFGRLWVRNLCRNLDALAAGRPVSELAGAFSGIPGLLLAAGPGLDQILPQLPELSRYAVVVAVDTAVAASIRAGATPDLAVVVDPQYWNTRHLDAVRPGATLLVSESSAHPTVFGHFRTPPLFCSSLFPLGRALEQTIGMMGTLGAGGSVSTTAWDLLRHLGCAPIYTAGLDLGFPGGRTHFEGSFFETRAVSLGNRYQPAESTLFRYISGGGPYLADAQPEGTLITDRRMEIYARWFEGQLAHPSAPPTFTLTHGGLRIRGLALAAPERLAGGRPVRDIVMQRLGAVGELSGDEHHQRRKAISRQLELLREHLQALDSLAGAALDALDSIRAHHARYGTADFAPLEQIDMRITEQGSREVVSFLMQDAIARIRSGFGSESLTEQFDASERLYGELRESVRYHDECLRNARENRSS
jgi:hypothetical protein